MRPTTDPIQAGPDADFAAILGLVQRGFAYMDGRIDPPSSMHRLTVESVREHAARGEIWTIGRVADGAAVACVFLTRRADRLYLGKLAVDQAWRGQGLARRLVETAEARARAMGLDLIELQARIELTENHATFAALGFARTDVTAHPGFDRPTSVTMAKRLRPMTRRGPIPPRARP